MILYKIMLCLVVFGAATACINTLQLYPYHAPESGNTGLTEAQVTDMTKNVGSSPLNMFTTFFVLMLLLNILLTVALSLITIIPFLLAWGIPLPLATAIQIPIWLVMGWGVYEMWSGHTPPMQD